MKKKHRKAFGFYVRWIADEMGLRDWHFELVFKEPTPHENPASGHMRIASCQVTPGRRLATLTFRSRDPSPSGQGRDSQYRCSRVDALSSRSSLGSAKSRSS